MFHEAVKITLQIYLHAQVNDATVNRRPDLFESRIGNRRDQYCFFFGLTIIEKVFTIQNKRKMSYIIANHTSNKWEGRRFSAIVEPLRTCISCLNTSPESF